MYEMVNEARAYRERVLSERTDAMIRAWTDGLRRRTEVSVLYGASARQR